MPQNSTPKLLGCHKKLRSPGDILGSGKTQQSILPFLSPSSSSQRASATCSPTPQLMSENRKKSPVSSESNRKRSKKKQSSRNMSAKRQHSLIELSSDDETSCENYQMNVVDSKDIPHDCNVRFGNVKRNLFSQCGETMSQTVVVLSSSEDSDFELHTSKKTRSFSSQSLIRQNHSDISHQSIKICSSTKLQKEPVVFATSTPIGKCVMSDKEFQDADSISVKIEEPEVHKSIEDDVMGYSSSTSASAPNRNQKLFCSKYKSSLEVSKIPPFVDTSTPTNYILVAGKEPHILESCKTPIIQPFASEIEELGRIPSLDHRKAEHSIIESQSYESLEIDPSTVKGNLPASVSPINFSPAEHIMAVGRGLHTGKTYSDTSELLHEETANSSINQLPSGKVIVSSSDENGSEEDSFYQPGNNGKGHRYHSNKKESGFLKSVDNATLLAETSCAGRISDSEDSQFEVLFTRQGRIEDSEEASFEILPPTPLASDNDNDSYILNMETNNPNSADTKADHKIPNMSAGWSNKVLDSDIFEQETNVPNDDEINLILSPHNETHDVLYYSSTTDRTHPMQLQNSGLCTREQVCDTSSLLTGCDVPSSSGKSSCSIATNEQSNDSAVGINDELSLKSTAQSPLRSTHLLSDETKTLRSSNNGSTTSVKVDPPITVAKNDLKGIELSSKISCGVPSEPYLCLVTDRPSSSSFPTKSANSIDHSYISRRPRSETILLDSVISECKTFAAVAFDHEPLRGFSSLYSSLTMDEKDAFHSILLSSLSDGDRWQRCADHFRKQMDRLASMNLVQYIGEHEDSLKLVDKLTNMEIISVFSSLGIKLPVDEGDIRELLILACKDGSKFGCLEKTKQSVKAVAHNKFLKIESDVIFCVKMCLELVSISMCLYDKFYRSVDIARFFGNTLRLSSNNVSHLLPLQLDASTKLINSTHEYFEFLNFCKLKTVFESGRFEDTSWINVSASLAVLDFSSEQNVLVKESPLFRVIYSNMVYILDDEFKRKCTSTQDSDIYGNIFFSLGVLLKQDVAGFSQKAVWSKKKIKGLSKIYSVNNIDVLCDILLQNVSTVEHIIRSEFVMSILENKNSVFSPKEKSEVAKHLRPKIHKKVFVENSCCTNYVGVVNYNALFLGRKASFRRSCLFEKYGPDFKYGLLDSGLVLLNSVFLVFWSVIYTPLDGAFVSRYQKCPLDWGSKRFYSKRWKIIGTRMASVEQMGVPRVVDEMKRLTEKFRGCNSVVDWTLVSSIIQEMYGVLEILGLTRFCWIANYLLQHLDERQVGLPDLILWNNSPPKIKFVAFKKPSDPLHPHQVVWLEKLSEFGIDVEECQIVPKLPTYSVTPAVTL